MNSRQALEIFDRYRGDAPVMVSSGRSGAILSQIGHRDPVMYNTGMAYTSPACLGLALARPDLKAVAIDGDGAMLMGLPSLVTIGRYLPRNLVVIVINNRAYRSTDRGELETATAVRADLVAFARAAGIECAAAASTTEEFERHFRTAMAEDGPWVIVANVDRDLVLDSPNNAYQPDRMELAVAFVRYLQEVRPAPAAPASVPVPDGRTPASSEGPGRAVARLIYSSLREAGIDFFVYLPDSVLYPVQELAERDPAMLTICCTREDEGAAIASGAAYAGRRPALVMEGTGVGLSGLALAGLIVRRTPLLIVSSHSEALGIRAPHDNISCMVNEPLLRALRIPVAVLSHAVDAGVVIGESARAAQVLKSPAAVVVPPYVMHQAVG